MAEFLMFFSYKITLRILLKIAVKQYAPFGSYRFIIFLKHIKSLLRRRNFVEQSVYVIITLYSLLATSIASLQLYCLFRIYYKSWFPKCHVLYTFKFLISCSKILFLVLIALILISINSAIISE